MKTSKKRSNRGSKKSDVGEQKSVSKISNFFKASEGSVETKGNKNIPANSKQFYIDALKKTLLSVENSNSFSKEIEEEGNCSEGGVASSSEGGVASSSEGGVASSSEGGVASSSEGGVASSSEGGVASSSEGGVASSSEGGVASSSEDVVASIEGRVSLINVSKKQIECLGCVQKSEELKQKDIEYRELETKYKESLKRYYQTSAYCSDLCQKYDILLKTGTRSGEPDEGISVFSDDIFSPSELKALKGISLEKKSDSTFILQCLRFAYKDDLSVMSSKSLCGTASSLVVDDEGQMVEVPGKTPLTPENVSRIRQLFAERLFACEIDSVEYGERMKDSKVNSLMCSGIKNIARKQQH